MAQYELNLRDYIRIFRRRRTAIILTFLLVLGSSTFFTRRQESSYQAVTTVKIEERKTVAGLLTEWIVYSPGDMMESQAKQIRGYQILSKTAYSMGIVQEGSPDAAVNAAVNDLQAKVSAERVGATNIIRIMATCSTSQEAIELANAVGRVYIDENLLEKTRQARHARQFIQEQLAALEGRLREKEDRLRQLAEQSKDLVISKAIQTKLTEMQFQLAELLQKYTPKHPTVIQLKERIVELEQQTKGLSGQDMEFNRLSREVEADRNLYAMLKEKLEEARITEAQKVGDITVVNPAVSAAVVTGSNQIFGLVVSAILGIVLGFAFALIIESLDTSIATIEDVEGLMKVPVLGVIPSVAMPGETTMRSGLMMRFKRKLMHRPKTHEEERYVRLVMHYNAASPVAEAYRNIYTNLKLDGSKKVFLVTSAGPREGKSTIMSNLGLTLAQAGMRTLIISSDIRRPSVGRTFGLKREPGLTEVLLGITPFDEAVRTITDIMLGEMDFDEVLQTPGMDNLWILPSGQLPFNPAKLLESRELEDLIAMLRERFDLVIFDSPPILPVTDASLIASRIDAVLMVYEIGRTTRDALLRAKNQLDAVGAQVCGVVLNQTRSEAEADIVYPYYNKYKYYREEPPQEKKSRATVKVS